jgi:hypothetical protein
VVHPALVAKNQTDFLAGGHVGQFLYANRLQT